ncbi:MAG: uridine diphosphate-N-acetylglucosamine-binding protein YvcK [Clostridia bacterium]|nr:uridine diphosphate-N-acetylglucosamine-binding protein YvcK [Clostridia bacterium]
MNGFIQWFKSSSKMKRWMLLILAGMILICLGIAVIISKKQMSFKATSIVVVTFVIGFLAMVVGLVCLNKRTLEVLIEATDERMNDRKNINVKSLIFDKKVYHQGPNIVVIGGGTGLNTVLTGLKKYSDNVTAIVTISDYGEAKSQSRSELQTMPLGDVKDSIISLANTEKQINQLFNYKFTEGRLKDLSFLDIYFTAMKNVNKDFTESIIKSNEILNITGKIIPVSTDEMNITAELDNGYVVKEKSKIPEMVYEKVTKINRIYLNPSNCKPALGVIEAIKEADCVVIGPGSLYTNVIPNLLVNGVAKAIKESTALKVYISNIMTEPGQTDEYGVSDHINAIIEHCGKGIIDYCIYDTGEIIPEFIKRYNLEGQDLVEPDVDKIKGITFLQRNLSMISNTCIRHDPELVAEAIIELICDDLKYQDKQNDPQYVMLNNKLREDKRINKIKKKMEKEAIAAREEDKYTKGNSKFADKYSDRIKSIKKSDEMIKLKEKSLKTGDFNEIIHEVLDKYIDTTIDNETERDEKNKKTGNRSKRKAHIFKAKKGKRSAH